MTSQEIIDLLEEIAPKNLAEDWDNVGLQIGDRSSKVRKILLALDVTREVVRYAVDEKIDMIISHHPLLFTSLKRIDFNTYKGNIIEELIKNNILVYSAHTNLDSSNNGVNDEFAELLNIENPKILSKTHSDTLYKITVNVPETHSDALRKSLSEVGAGSIGDYSSCSFTSKGIGRFKPEEGSHPYLGSKGEIERVEEEKIEVITEGFRLNHVIEKMLQAHPYEEVAYDIIRLENESKSYGIGRYGRIEKMTLEELAKKTKEKLGARDVRVYGKLDKQISTIALAGGSGSDFIADAYKKKVDAYITADIKHHDAQMAEELGISLIDAGHFYTEKIVMNRVKKYLDKRTKSDIKIIIAENDNIAPYNTL